MRNESEVEFRQWHGFVSHAGKRYWFRAERQPNGHLWIQMFRPDGQPMSSRHAPEHKHKIEERVNKWFP